MPHKANAARRHHIPRPKRRVLNWSEYDAPLRQRGSLTLWVNEEAIAQWKAAPRRTPGGQASYSDLAITTALMLRAVFRLALRQTEGLIGSILHLLGLHLLGLELLGLELLGLELPVPDHSRDRLNPGGPSHMTERSMPVWSEAKVPFITTVRIFGTRWAPRRDQHIRFPPRFATVSREDWA